MKHHPFQHRRGVYVPRDGRPPLPVVAVQVPQPQPAVMAGDNLDVASARRLAQTIRDVWAKRGRRADVVVVEVFFGARTDANGNNITRSIFVPRLTNAPFGVPIDLLKAG